MGFLIGGRGKTPIIAMFTSANKVAGKIKENLHKELVDILTGFQNKNILLKKLEINLVYCLILLILNFQVYFMVMMLLVLIIK